MLKSLKLASFMALCLLLTACGGKKETEIEVLSSDQVSVTGNSPKLLTVPAGQYRISCIGSKDAENGMLEMQILLKADKSEMKQPNMTSPVKVALMGENGQKLDLSLTMQDEERQRFEKWIGECAQGAVEEFRFNSAAAKRDFWEDVIGDVRSIRLEDVNAGEGEKAEETKDDKSSKPKKAANPVYFSLSGTIGDAYDASMEMNGTTGSVSFTADDRFQYMQLRLVSNDNAGNLVVQSYHDGKRIATYRGRYTGGAYSGTAKIWNGTKVSFYLR